MRSFFSKLDRHIILIFFLSAIFFHKLFLNPSQMISPAVDTVSIYYHLKSFLITSILSGNGLPLWDPYIFSGMPLLGNPESAVFSPFNIFYLIFPVYFAFGFSYFFNTFLIGVFTYLFAKLIKLSKFSSVLSAAIMMFSGPLIILIYPGHTYVMSTLVWFPLLLYFFELSFLKDKILYSLPSGIVLGFISVSGHFQPGLYGFFAACLYLILRIVFSKDKSKVRLLSVLIITPVVAFCLFAVQLIPTLELLSLSNRAKAVSYVFASDFSLPPKQLISFILPNFFGNPIVGNYWGKGNFWSLCGYLGVIPLILTLFAIFKKRNKFVWIFLILGIFALIFSFGKYSFLFPFFYKYVPFFDSFRVPSRFLYIYVFSFSILAGIGFDALFNLRDGKILKLGKILLSFGFLWLLVTFIFNLFPQKVLFFEKYLMKPYYAIKVSRELILNQIVVDLMVFWSFLILFSVFLILKSKVNGKLTNYFLLALIILNLWFYWLNYYDTKDISTVFLKSKPIEIIKKDNSFFRVYDQTGQLIPELENAGLESVSGISAVISTSYRNFFHTSGDYSDSKNDVFIDVTKINNLTPLRLLNVRYLISKKEINNANLILKQRANNNLYQIKNTLPRAYLVPNAINVRDEKESLLVIKNSSFDPQKTVLLEGHPDLEGSQEFKDLTINSKTPDKIILGDFFSKKGFLVLSEIWYPGWKAYDGNKEIKIYKGNGILRAIPVSEGKHTISFTYESFSFRVGLYLSIFSVVGLIIITAYLNLNRKRLKSYLHL